MEASSWLRLGGVEIASNERTLSYLRRGIAGVNWNVVATGGNLDDATELACGCEYADVGPYVSPSVDPAPWLDETVPASARYLGLLVDRIQVGGQPSRAMTATRVGSVLGPIGRPGRPFTVTGRLLALSADALDFGERWLASQLVAGGGDCELATLELLPSCVEPVAGPVRRFNHAEPPAGSGWYPTSTLQTALSLTPVDPYTGGWSLRMTRVGAGVGVVGVRSAQLGGGDDPDLVYALPPSTGRVTFVCQVRADPGVPFAGYEVNVRVSVVLRAADWSTAVGQTVGRVTPIVAGAGWQTFSLTATRGIPALAAGDAAYAQVTVEVLDAPTGYVVDLAGLFLFPGQDPIVEAPTVGLLTGLLTEWTGARDMFARAVTFQIASEAPYMAARTSEPLWTYDATEDGWDTASVRLDASVATGEAVDLTVWPGFVTSGLVVEMYAYDPATTHVGPPGVIDQSGVIAGLPPDQWSAPVAAWQFDDLAGIEQIRFDHATRQITVLDSYGVPSPYWAGVNPDPGTGFAWFDLAPGVAHLLRLRWGGPNLLGPEGAYFTNPTSLGGWAPNLSTTVAYESNGVFAPNKLKITSTAAVLDATAAVMVPVVPGEVYVAEVKMQHGPVAPARTVRMRLTYYQADGVTPTGTTVTVDAVEAVLLSGSVLLRARALPAPADAALMQVRVGARSVASGEVHYLSDAYVRTGYTAPPAGSSRALTIWADRRVLLS